MHPTLDIEMKNISRFIIKLFGWKLIGELPKDNKYVIISMPHTSMWDFIWGKFTFWGIGLTPAVFIKKELFFFPLGLLLKALGALPIDRTKSTGMVGQVIEHFNKNEKFSVCITPEGTRKRAPKLKRGFYFIAKQANVPIFFGVLDYKKKILMFGDRFMPTGDIEADMASIREYYTRLNPTGKHPEQFSLDSIQ